MSHGGKLCNDIQVPREINLEMRMLYQDIVWRAVPRAGSSAVTWNGLERSLDSIKAAGLIDGFVSHVVDTA